MRLGRDGVKDNNVEQGRVYRVARLNETSNETRPSLINRGDHSISLNLTLLFHLFGIPLMNTLLFPSHSHVSLQFTKKAAGAQ